MHAEFVNRRAELAECVEPCFAPALVVRVAPIGAQSLHVGKRRALAAIADGFAVGPARRRQVCVMVVERGYRHGELEWLDLACRSNLLAGYLRAHLQMIQGVSQEVEKISRPAFQR